MIAELVITHFKSSKVLTAGGVSGKLVIFINGSIFSENEGYPAGWGVW